MSAAEPALRVSPRLAWRREYFGVFVWAKDRSEFYRLAGIEAALFYVAGRKAPITAGWTNAIPFHSGGIPPRDADVQQGLARLQAEGLLIPEEAGEKASTSMESAISAYAADRPAADIAKPVWVHLQPFTFCNLTCVHCYCFSSPTAAKFRLPIDQWREMIAKLDTYGIAEVFITGGETLLLEGTWQLVEEIRRRALGTGLSTNALHITPHMIAKLREFGIRRIQVSMDGGTPATHDHLRARPGAFAKTVENLRTIATVSEPVINTVVNKLNLAELDAIVRIGLNVGANKFKFFPQKSTGRAAALSGIALSDTEVEEILVPLCLELANTHDVTIETVSTETRCGSARSGFSVDELGDVYPCIFGIGDADQRAGSLVHDSIDAFWFNATVMRRFRANASQPCHRCERVAA